MCVSCLVIYAMNGCMLASYMLQVVGNNGGDWRLESSHLTHVNGVAFSIKLSSLNPPFLLPVLRGIYIKGVFLISFRVRLSYVNRGSHFSARHHWSERQQTLPYSKKFW